MPWAAAPWTPPWNLFAPDNGCFFTGWIDKRIPLITKQISCNKNSGREKIPRNELMFFPGVLYLLQLRYAVTSCDSASTGAVCLIGQHRKITAIKCWTTAHLFVLSTDIYVDQHRRWLCCWWNEVCLLPCQIEMKRTSPSDALSFNAYIHIFPLGAIAR